jgi:RNA polymerase sigma factor (sigma-70 family)
MDERARLADHFERHRTHLRAVAYRMLGSLAEADEAVQDAWLRASRAGAEGIENLAGWLTTIVARVCLNALQARSTRPAAAPAVHIPDPIVTPDGELDPEHEILLADSVGLALQIVLATLPPAERLAFVLHDMFDFTFDEIAPMVGRTSTATRQLASRARRRIKSAAVPASDADLTRQREVVDAFFAAAHAGDMEALLDLLDPDVVLRSDGGPKAIANTALTTAFPNAILRPALVNGTAGMIVLLKDRPFAIMGFTVTHDKIKAIDVILDPDRLVRLGIATLLHSNENRPTHPRRNDTRAASTSHPTTMHDASGSSTHTPKAILPKPESGHTPQ